MPELPSQEVCSFLEAANGLMSKSAMAKVLKKFLKARNDHEDEERHL